jgi:hypothetical protein
LLFAEAVSERGICDLSRAINPIRYVARWVITTLGRIGPGGRSAVRRLQPFLTNTSVALRVLSARALWQITSDPKPLVPVLRKIIEEDPINIPAFAFAFDAGASNSVSMRSAAGKFPRYVHRTHLGAVTAAIYLLGEMGEAAEAALPALRKIEKNMNESPSIEGLFTVRAVSKITGDSSGFLSLLLKHLNSDSRDAAYIRIPTIHFLAELGAAAGPAIDRLQVLSTNKELGLAFAATNAIHRIRGPVLGKEGEVQ